jgi:hypothetical protein
MTTPNANGSNQIGLNNQNQNPDGTFTAHNGVKGESNLPEVLGEENFWLKPFCS